MRNTIRTFLITSVVCTAAGVTALIGLSEVANELSEVANETVSEEQRAELIERVLSGAFKSDRIDYGFHVVDGQVVFEGRNHASSLVRKKVLTPVEGADAATFRTLNQVFPERGSRVYYGVDKNYVYVEDTEGIRRIDADPTTFRLLDLAGRFARDKDSVYYRAVKIEGADPNSFRRLHGDFSVDDNHAYLGHLVVPADASTFEATSSGYVSNVWHNDRVTKRPNTIAGWSRDAKNIYYGIERFDPADRETFQDLSFASYAKDAYHVYYKTEIVPEADPETFEILGTQYLDFFPPSLKYLNVHGPLARDKDHFYFDAEIYERDGPWFHENDENDLERESVKPGTSVHPPNVLSESLDKILRKHEAQLARSSTLQVDWSVTYHEDADNPTRVEHYRTSIAPGYERSTRLAPGAEVPDHYLWDGASFHRMPGYSREEYLREPTSITAVNGLLYREDSPVHRLFQWRSLRAYRVYANECDLSLRELCEQSLEQPEFDQSGDFVQIQIVHPGSLAFNQRGRLAIPKGARVSFELDAARGYLVTGHGTTFALNRHGKRFSQQLSVQTYKEFPGGVFLPSRVSYSAQRGRHETRQTIDIEYSAVNQPIETDQPFFPENLLVTEFKTCDAANPVGCYVVRADGTLGEQFPSERVASLVRAHRMNDSESLIAPQMKKLSAAPDVGDAAPPIRAMNILSGQPEAVEFQGRVTLVEFWATWCGPCQPAMQRINDLANERSERWEDRVQFVTISVDDDHGAAERRLRTRGWLGTRTLVDTPVTGHSLEDIGFPSVAAQDYVVTGVPTSLLIDDHGNIVFRGHPASVDFAERIEQLLESRRGSDTVLDDHHE